MTLTLTTYDEAETTAFGRRLGALLPGGAVVLLDGDLGAGKTRLAQGVAKGLGVEGIVTSPTFNLVLEYPLCVTGTGSLGQRDGAGAPVSSETGAPAPSLCPKLLRHFDLYRLDRAEQLEDLDYFGLIEETDTVSLVEWGNKFDTCLPLDYILVSIMVDGDDPSRRLFELSAEGPRSKELLEQIALIEGAEQNG